MVLSFIDYSLQLLNSKWNSESNNEQFLGHCVLDHHQRNSLTTFPISEFQIKVAHLTLIDMSYESKKNTYL